MERDCFGEILIENSSGCWRCAFHRSEIETNTDNDRKVLEFFAKITLENWNLLFLSENLNRNSYRYLQNHHHIIHHHHWQSSALLSRTTATNTWKNLMKIDQSSRRRRSKKKINRGTDKSTTTVPAIYELKHS
ncbi:WD repeat domain phosphoinositide-interacting protein 4-like [Sarcoptes scabiei]|nr:WD repeat domain phosphoinositide-interacting protein 4-like [Sarcoptes scabiei]